MRSFGRPLALTCLTDARGDWSAERLYGLRRAPRARLFHARSLLLERGFVQSIWGPRAFLRFESEPLQGFVGLRVDDASMAGAEAFWNVIESAPLRWGTREHGNFVFCGLHIKVNMP